MDIFPTPSDVLAHGLEVRRANGELMLFCGSRAFRPTLYAFDPYKDRDWQSCVRRMYEDGIRVISFLAPLNTAWDNEGAACDFTLLDRLQDEILSIAPQALLMPRLFMTTPFWWDRKYPDELMKMDDEPLTYTFWGHEKDDPLWKCEAKNYHDTRNASIASRQWRNDAGNALSAYVRHVQQKYPGHFFAFQIAYGTCGEWGLFGSYKNGRFSYPDCSAPVLREFRDFLRTKYRTDANLAKAWKRPDVTLETAMPPTKLEATEAEFYTLKDPRRHRQLADWGELYTKLRSDSLRHFCQMVKQASEKPVLTAAFGGAVMQEGASAYRRHFFYNAMDLIHIPELDIVCYPNWNIDNRIHGVGAQGCTATLARRKIFLAECDALGYLKGTVFDSTPFPKTRREARFSIARDTLFNLTSGQGLFWLYDFGTGWHRTPEIRKVVRSLVQIQRQQKSCGCAPAEIAVVHDWASSNYCAGDIAFMKQTRQLVDERLPASGYPYDVIDLEEFFKAPRYRLYIFQCLFYCPMALQRRIRVFLEKNQASAVWFHAAGALSERGIHPEKAWNLTGIKVQANTAVASSSITLHHHSHPLCANLEIPFACGDTGDLKNMQSPLFSACDPDAEILGLIESIGLPGLVVKENEKRFDCWSESAILPEQLIANLAEKAGCHAHGPVGVHTYGGGRLRVFWSQKDMQTIIPWPGQTLVKELLSGRVYRSSVGEFSILIKRQSPILLTPLG